MMTEDCSINPVKIIYLIFSVSFSCDYGSLRFIEDVHYFNTSDSNRT